MNTYEPQFPAGHLASEPGTLVDLILKRRRAPGYPAIDDGTTVLTYAELIEQMRSFGLTLHEHGVGPGDKVGVRVSSGSVDLYVSILSVLMIGAAYVPVDVDDPDERARTVFEEANVAAVITDGPTITKVTTRETPPELRAPVPEDDCWVIFTRDLRENPRGCRHTPVRGRVRGSRSTDILPGRTVGSIRPSASRLVGGIRREL